MPEHNFGNQKFQAASWWKVLLNTFLFLLACFIGGIIYLFILSRDLPSIAELQRFNPEQVSKILSADGIVIKELYIHKRDVVNISQIPRSLRHGLLAMEDRNFFEHSGVSFQSLARAVIVNMMTLSRRQGASTITQQLARNMYNTIGFEKTYTRKLKELITSINIEQTFTKTQKRGGKGKTGIKTREEDSVVQTLSVNTHTQVLFFSTEGLVYRVKAWKIPESSASSRGKSLFNILPLKNHQSISSIMPYPEETSDKKGMHIIFATAKGKIRKNNLEDFSSINTSGKIAMKLDVNDKIVGVKICKDDQDIILSTKFGKCIRFKAKKLRVFKGRSSKGIRGINLHDKDTIVSLSIIDHDSSKKNGKLNKDVRSEIKAKEKYILSIKIGRASCRERV